jgi:tRNA threonylcarbamoyl adenosine modification protein YeaZ
MEWVLGIDTSSIELSLGLACDGRPVAGVSRYRRNSHAENIAEAADFLLKSNGVAADDIRHAAIAVGPGSFTGLRIGISFIKGFCFGRETRLLQVSSLQAVACAWIGADGPLVVAFDARQDRIFWARFACGGSRATRLTDDAIASVEEFTRLVRNDDTVIFDTMGYDRSTAFASIAEHSAVHAVERFPLQRGLACAALAAQTSPASENWRSADSIEPRYLAPSYGAVPVANPAYPEAELRKAAVL